jgi:transcriptional regulator with XRE-family HTH domain
VTKDARRAAIRLELVLLIGDERRRKHLSKNGLAVLTGLNQSTVSRLENHPDNPTLDSLQRVTDALDLNLGKLLQRAIQNIDRKRSS